MFTPLVALRSVLIVAFMAVECVKALPQPSEPPSVELLEAIPSPAELIRAAETGEFKVVPGPGLPSLESLNFTSRDLVVRALERIERSKEAQEDRERSSSFTKRYTPTCDWHQYLISMPNAWACHEYLHSIGSVTCAVPSSGSRFCHTVSGNADVAWYGRVNGVSYTQSSCANVANGGVWVLNNCILTAFPSIPVLNEGTNAAWGNENLIVEIRKF
ncbi:hypothetical protein CC1G_01479 [Coprinopsis cinerea okayama7|uniref:Secreted protein n=1 Tax=Coprinopsis cinerea (strain Okayama-7 / 130 / ATCC MYA-4618 / FGSC 9003) TaxID=240176 RepID=A8NHQ3_COPC7|nr:hypothetical protein CC1G_01479 [Coprinopsis cinerea okayama7\|eukprot:XP_001833802.1 hypothetical protein CC1G_01479 [Coprinopsis cinerea okayama7\